VRGDESMWMMIPFDMATDTVIPFDASVYPVGDTEQASPQS
jgi:hypothetical protein